MSESPWLCSLVKHNVAAKHGSSKPLTFNELWLLELRIKSNCILAPLPDALWDMCKSSITTESTLGYPVYNPYTPCSWFWKNVAQGECEFSIHLPHVIFRSGLLQRE